MILAATLRLAFVSLHKIEAHPSGEITEYIEFSNIKILSPVAKAIAPPDPPSPIIIEIIGDKTFKLVEIVFAIAQLALFSSASLPGYAPAVSTKSNNR